MTRKSVLPNYLQIALRCLDGDASLHGPLHVRLALELELMFNRGRARGRLESPELGLSIDDTQDID